jgi:SAM-dependent methyltransferase
VRRAEADLARYYDQEAVVRANRAIDPHRVARRDAFVARMRSEDASTVVEVGTGPGRDAAAFLDAGIGVVGIDLSSAHVRLPRANGVGALRASVYALPFPEGAFAAGWTMSTLVHIPNERFDAALTQICRVIRPGGLLAIGLWGAPTDIEEIAEWDTIVPKRFFSRRSDDRVRAMLEPYGRVLEFDTWTRDTESTWTYQFLVVRTNASDCVS